MAAALPHDGDRDEAPGQQSMFTEPVPSHDDARSQRGSAHMRGTRALERLRERVELVITELDRLRRENAALKRELESVHKDGQRPSDGVQIAFTESPAELREALQTHLRFINELIEAENSGTEEEVTS